VVSLTHRTIVLLKEPADAPHLSEAEQARLQAQHLDHLTAMRERRAMITAGPFRRQDDAMLRGMCLYRTNLEETRALAESDPAVRAGILCVEAFEWHFPEGDLPR